MQKTQIELQKKADRLLVKELGIRHFARHVGFDDIGNPIELVYNVSDNNYEWHIGGEFLKEASDSVSIRFLQPANSKD